MSVVFIFVFGRIFRKNNKTVRNVIKQLHKTNECWKNKTYKTDQYFMKMLHKLPQLLLINSFENAIFRRFNCLPDQLSINIA